MRKSLEKREEKRQRVEESDQTSLLINDDKNIGEIKYKTLLAEKNLKKFFPITNKQAKKHQQPRDFRSVGRLFFIDYHVVNVKQYSE